MFTTTHDIILLAIALLYFVVWIIRASKGMGGAWLAVPLIISGACALTAVLW